VADVQFENNAAQSTSHPFSHVWKLTRALKKAGATYKGSGDGTNVDKAGSSDKWGSNADPANDTYPTALDSVAAWWLGELNFMVKVPITTAPTGTFLRGERVTQADGSEGEFQGYVINAAGNSGHAIIRPRSASGTWTGTGTITGAWLGGTLTPSATPRIFKRQILFVKTTTTTSGFIGYVSADAASETAQFFTTLMATAGCTATVAPGFTNTLNSTNNYPTTALAFLGGNTSIVSGATGTITYVNWCNGTSNVGNGHIVAMNQTGATGLSGVTPDGSFWVEIDNTNTPGTFSGFGLFLCDDTEAGDVDPYTFKRALGGSWTYAQNAATTGPAADSIAILYGGGGSGTTAATWSFHHYCARGSGTSKDAGCPGYAQWEGAGSGSSIAVGYSTGGESFRVANHPDGATAPFYQQRPAVWSDYTGRKIRKGVPRWLTAISTGVTKNTSDTKRWLLVTSQSNGVPSLALGQLDGTTTPV
jgi:hypothetical protein